MNSKSLGIAGNFPSEIKRLMNADKLYRDAALDLSGLEQLMNIPKRKLSRLIRYYFNKSFPDFLNDYRLNEVLFRFQKYDHRKHTIVAIALEAGFTSKSTFYRHFKKKLLRSPSEFLRYTKI